MSRITFIMSTFLIVVSSGQAQNSFVNGSFEDSASEGDGLGGLFGWTDEMGNHRVDYCDWWDGPNHGQHWINLFTPDGGESIDLSQHITGLTVGDSYVASFAAAWGGLALEEAGIRWIPGDTTGTGKQQADGEDMGSIGFSPASTGYVVLGGIPRTAQQSDYTLYLYAVQEYQWSCGTAVDFDAPSDGESFVHQTGIVDWALY